MAKCGFIVIFVIFFILNENAAKQWFNANTDFLLHEAGRPASNPNTAKRDYVANPPSSTTKKEDFPPLGPSHVNAATKSPIKSSTASTTRSTGKRDYVAPAHSQTTKSNLPPLTPTTARTTSPHTTRVTQSTGKRDYVAPNVPTLKPVTNAQGSGKVKDLVNFYDSKSQQHSTPKVPSYSSILQGSTKKHDVVAQSTPTVPTNQTPKPISFSSVVSGSTAKPTSVSSPSKPGTSVNHGSTSRPVVLPSAISNSNQGGNGIGATNSELQTLSEELLKRDTNNAAKYITINYQEKTTSQSTDDKAPLPLLTISPEAWNIPTIQKFLPLLDNYERDTLVNEYVTPQERNEENEFMDAIMSTSVVRHLMNFFKDKGYVTPDPRQQRDFLKQIWFGLYSRGKGKLSSSGFEHVFVSELKNGQVSGLHNWIYFSREEQANRLNYLGYLKYAELNGKGAVVKLHLNQQGVDKPVDAIFVGTSPELEVALYTLCFVTRVDNDCRIKLAGKDVNVATYKFRYRSKNYIGSAFPQI